MQSRNEAYFISFLQLALLFISKFPVDLVDKDQNSWASGLKYNNILSFR